MEVVIRKCPKGSEQKRMGEWGEERRLFTDVFLFVYLFLFISSNETYSITYRMKMINKNHKKQ